MKFKFSNHAIEQIQIRRIPKEAVGQVLDNPDQIIDVNGKKIYQSIIVIENKKYYEN